MAFLKPDLRMVNAWPRLPSHHAVCRCRRSWPWFLPGRPCPACQPAGDISGGNSSQGTPAALVGGHLRRQGPHVCQKTVTGSVAPSEHPSWPLQTSLVLPKRLCVRAGIGDSCPPRGLCHLPHPHPTCPYVPGAVLVLSSPRAAATASFHLQSLTCQVQSVEEVTQCFGHGWCLGSCGEAETGD